MLLCPGWNGVGNRPAPSQEVTIYRGANFGTQSAGGYKPAGSNPRTSHIRCKTIPPATRVPLFLSTPQCSSGPNPEQASSCAGREDKASAGQYNATEKDAAARRPEFISKRTDQPHRASFPSATRSLCREHRMINNRSTEARLCVQPCRLVPLPINKTGTCKGRRLSGGGAKIL
jgi:hypothetical protein